VRARGGLDDSALTLLGEVVEPLELAEARLVGGNRVGVVPRAVRVGVEVVARLDGVLAGAEVEAEGADGGLGPGGGRGRGSSRGGGGGQGGLRGGGLGRTGGDGECGRPDHAFKGMGPCSWGGRGWIGGPAREIFPTRPRQAASACVPARRELGSPRAQAST